MKIGTGLPNQVRDVRPDVIPDFARSAEDAGFELLSTVGRHAYPGVSDTVALGDGEKGKANIHDYYSVAPDFAELATGAVCDTPAKVKEAISAFSDLGADALVFNCGTDDVEDIKRLADIVF